MNERCVILHLCDKIENSNFNMTRKRIVINNFLQTLGKTCFVAIIMKHSNKLLESHWKLVFMSYMMAEEVLLLM